MNSCVFCELATDYKDKWVFDIQPLNPVVSGHRLFIPTRHVEDAARNHSLTGLVFERAAMYAAGKGEDFNLITSAGSLATQTIKHLHVHYIPRRLYDGLRLPWITQTADDYRQGRRRSAIMDYDLSKYDENGNLNEF